ncbi:MAG TPA: hypothetical protein VN688_23740 [Gemmataceae bacterium]|nr:hypothetical protein [Gemmataceae bacterium]
MNKHYRVVPPLSGIEPASAFLDRVYTEVPADKPDHPTCYEGEWVCSHSPCPVRAVRVRVKAHFHKHLPRLRCPLCFRTLDFRHWLSLIALQEVPSESPQPIALPPCTKRGGVRRRKRKPSPGTDAAASS